MIASQRARLRLAALFWAIPAILLALAFIADWHQWLKVLFGLLLFSGAVQQFNEFGRLRDYQRKQRLLTP